VLKQANVHVVANCSGILGRLVQEMESINTKLPLKTDENGKNHYCVFFFSKLFNHY
jgi:hypothetical protein